MQQMKLNHRANQNQSVNQKQHHIPSLNVCDN